MVFTQGDRLLSDGNVDELHRFAQAIGLPQNAFIQESEEVHYRISSEKMALAVNKGAKRLTGDEPLTPPAS